MERHSWMMVKIGGGGKEEHSMHGVQDRDTDRMMIYFGVLYIVEDQGRHCKLMTTISEATSIIYTDLNIC